MTEDQLSFTEREGLSCNILHFTITFYYSRWFQVVMMNKKK